MRRPRSDLAWWQKFEEVLGRKDIREIWTRWIAAGVSDAAGRQYLCLASAEPPNSDDLRSRLFLTEPPAEAQRKIHEQHLFYGEDVETINPRCWRLYEVAGFGSRMIQIAGDIKRFGTLPLARALAERLPMAVNPARLAKAIRFYGWSVVEMIRIGTSQFPVPDRKRIRASFFALLCLYLKQQTGSVPFAELATLLDALSPDDPNKPVTEPALRQRLRRFRETHADDYERLRKSVRHHPDDPYRHFQIILVPGMPDSPPGHVTDRP